VLLPSVLVTFLASGAKFLFFDTEICRSRIWLSGEDGSSPQMAESCSLSTDAIINIIGCVLAFANILLVCLKAPKKRLLEENFGFYDDDKFEEGLRSADTDLMEDSICETFSDDIECQVKSRESKKALMEKQKERDANNQSPTGYDMIDIRDQGNEGRDEDPKETRVESYTMSTIPMPQANPRKPTGKSIVSKRKTKVDWDSERLRETEESVIHEDKDFSRDLSRSDLPRMDLTRNESISETTEIPTVQKIVEDSNGNNSSLVSYKNNLSNSMNYSRDEYENTMSTYSINKSFRRGLLSPCAPSDESSFMTLSPRRNVIKPTIKSNKTPPRVTLPSRKSSNKKKLSPAPPSMAPKEKYDDDLIKKCVVDLTKSFETKEWKD